MGVSEIRGTFLDPTIWGAIVGVPYFLKSPTLSGFQTASRGTLELLAHRRSIGPLNMREDLCACMYVCMHACMYAYIYIYIYIYMNDVYLYVYMYR